jgi:polar amino acid transport system substrate-binding protein
MSLSRLILLSLLLNSFFQYHAFAQEGELKTLRVAIKPSEPWVMYDTSLPDDKKQPIGFSIDLWRGIAKEIDAKTQWVYTKNVPELLKTVQEGRADVGISAITIRSDREKVVDFSTSMFELGLQIMVREETGLGSPFTVLIEEISQFLTLENLIIFYSPYFA